MITSAILFVMAVIGAILNRIRGGWIKEEYMWGSTHLCRLAWALPTGVLLFMGTTPQTEMWYRAGLLVTSVFVSYAFLGHGAHMVMDFQVWKDIWKTGRHPSDVELVTTWWLPKLFGGTPNATWSENKFYAYHIVGMGAIGLIRHLLMILPVIIIAPITSVEFTVAGALLGVMYYIGAQMPPITWKNFSPSSGSNGEVYAGGYMWILIGVLYYVFPIH